MATISEILEDIRKFIEVKQASFQGGFKRAQSVADISTMPGSEHDSKVPSEYENPDPEVDDGTQGPEGAFSTTTGAGNDSDPTMQHVLEVDEPAENPDEEPLITDEADAEPKTASATKLANQLLSRIKDYNQKKAAGQKKASGQKIDLNLDASMLDKLAKVVAAVKQAKPAEKKVAEGSKASEAKPVEKKAAEDGKAPEAKPVEDSKPAEKKAEPVSEKRAAIKQSLLNTVQKIREAREAEKQAAVQKGAEDAFFDVLGAAYDRGVADTLEKLAQMPIDPAMAAGGQDAMAAMAGAPAEAAPAETLPAEAAPAEDQAGGSDIDVPQGMEGEDVSIEDVVDALDTAVATGELDQETAEAVLSELVAGADDGGAPAEAAPEESGKEASVKFAQAINEARAQIIAQQAEQIKFAQAIEEAANEIDAASNDDSGDNSDVDAGDDQPISADEVEQAVAELVDEGEIDADTGAAILEQLGSDAAPAEGGSDEPSGDEPSAEDVVQGLADLVESGEISAEDAEDALHALVGGEE